MPPKSVESLLFHKKKPIKKESSGALPNGTPSSPRKSATPRQQPTPPKADDVDDTSKLPEGEYSEYKLMSSALNGWKYDVMKFDSRKLVDVSTWEEPIKLNRKDLRRQEAVSTQQVPAGPMLGPDGKPVIGSDGRIVMVDSDGRPITDTTGEGSSSKEKEGKGKGPGKKKITRKTRQVFKVPEEVRQLRREERYPWVMEDARQNEVWVGQLEEVSKADTHALFMPAAQEVFKFVPAHRWYKFHKKPKHHIPNLEEAESLMAKIQKNKDPERWLLHRRHGQGPSAATSAMFKSDPETRVVAGGAPLVHNVGQSRGPGGRMLRTVNRGSQGAEEDEEGNVRPKREDDGEGHLDEQLFEEDVADDDEHEAADMDDEEAKELEERLKREYKLANKQREGFIDESDEDEDESQLSKDGKSLKKLMRKLEKNGAYESDEERNPYASSDENEEEEEPAPVSNEPAIQQQPQQVKSRSASQQPTQKPSQSSANSPTSDSAVGSRAVSPVPAPGMGGHSVVAKRATSPKVPKPKSANVSRGNSPLSVAPGAGSRATSPTAGGSKGPGSPVPSSSSKITNKRKAEEVTGAASAGSINGASGPKAKKRKPTQSGPVPEGELEERMLIEWLQNTPNATTRDCIQHFTPYLTSEGKKAKFTAMVKEVAQLKGGVLVLKSTLL
ncbi:Rap30/74 interaction domain-containing protein [Paxillus ammoniavirescens]|nr:Rap30/74 interaction domain-containing protein [Paxillus ammoniavirescens]